MDCSSTDPADSTALQAAGVGADVAHNRLRSPETKKRHRPLSATSRGYGRPRRRRNWSRSGGVHQPYPLIETAHDKTAAA